MYTVKVLKFFNSFKIPVTNFMSLVARQFGCDEDLDSLILYNPQIQKLWRLVTTNALSKKQINADKDSYDDIDFQKVVDMYEKILEESLFFKSYTITYKK